MSTEIRLEIEERQTTEGKDYYVAQTFMLGARWLIFVYDAVKDEKSGRWIRPGFLEVRPTKESDKQLHDVCDKFSVPLFVKRDRLGNEFLGATFKVLGAEFICVIFYPERCTDSDEILKNAVLILRPAA